MVPLQNDSTLLADGAIGEYLFSLGYPARYLACEAVVRSPEILASIHREYAEAGAGVLTTNTFDANILKLDSRGMADRCHEINRMAVELAARNSDVLIMGSIGPPGSGRSFRTEHWDSERLHDIYSPQISGLLQGGVDIILLETQVDPLQARTLYDLVRTHSEEVPIAVSFTYGHDLLTPSGFSIEDSVKAFGDADPVMLGANHGIGPLQFLDIYRRLVIASPFPILLEPNSGTGRYVDGGFVFPDNPDHFCRCMMSCAGERTALIGGCCGTKPSFVSAMRRRLQRSSEVEIFPPAAPGDSDEDPEAGITYDPPVLSSQISSRDALIVELLPPRGGDLSLFAKRADRLRRLSPVTVSIPDSPMGKVRMSPSICGLYLKEKLGIEPLVHFALRDRSLTRIQSDLLALAGSGLQGIFLISGDPPSLGDYPEATAVYDLTTEQTLELVGNLSRGIDLNRRKIGTGAGFFPGSAVSLGEKGSGEKMKRRWDCGCRFFISQPVYSRETILRSMDLMVEYPVIPSFMPLRNRYSAEYLASEVPGISIPEDVLSRIRELDEDDVLPYSLDHLSGLMEEARGAVAGVYLAGSRKGTVKLAEQWRRLN